MALSKGGESPPLEREGSPGKQPPEFTTPEGRKGSNRDQDKRDPAAVDVEALMETGVGASLSREDVKNADRCVRRLV